MNNELADDLEGAKLVILRLNDTLLQLQDDFKKMQVSNQSWEIIAKGYGKTIEEQQAEIEALKDKLMLSKQSLEIVEGWIKK